MPAASTDDLIVALRAVDRATRRSAARELVARGEAARAVAAVDDHDLGLVIIVLRGLRHRDLPPDVPELLWASRHRQAKVDALAYWSHADPDRAERAAFEGLLSRSRVVRRQSQSILHLRGVDVAECYRTLLTHGHDEAARALGELGRPDDVPALLAHLDAPGPRIRRLALKAIARLLRKDAEPLLVSLLSGPDPVLAETAERLLCGWPPSRAALAVAWQLSCADDRSEQRPYAFFHGADTWWLIHHACLAVAGRPGRYSPQWEWYVRNCVSSWRAPSTGPDPAERDAIRAAVTAALDHLPADDADALRRATEPYLGD